MFYIESIAFIATELRGQALCFRIGIITHALCQEMKVLSAFDYDVY